MTTCRHKTLEHARLELHYAAQVLSAWADAWLSARPDDGHTAMTWDGRALVGERSDRGESFALRTVDFSLVAQRHGAADATLSLAGVTLADAMAWADRQFGAPRDIHLRGGDYDMPACEIATGAVFAVDRAALAAIADWYDIGATALARAVIGWRASTIRVWPHHFDLGAILYRDAAIDTRQIGLGFSPGDKHYSEPYAYVTPSPMPTTRPPLDGGGFWRTEGWDGAVLQASAVIDVHAFMSSAIAAGQ
ncbi:hypothetical protein BH11MYX2_BH11MYX2_23200 [soil metagenome]